MASSIQNNRVTGSSYCSCLKVCNMWCWRVFKWLPVLLIVSIITWSYYAYVIQLCIFAIDNTVQKCFYLVFYHILLVLFVWSYWQTIFSEVQPIPEKFRLPESELEKLLSAENEDAQRIILENFAKNLPIVTRTMAGSVRYCNRCILVKPDRAHHCSMCSRCVLKMDHHCPWVNNCVCFHNYKFFILFLGYALLYCLFIMFTSLPSFIRFWKIYQDFKHDHCDNLVENSTYKSHCLELLRGEFGNSANAGRYHVVFAFFVALMFAISLGSLFVYHCYLVTRNRTTLEAFRAPMFRSGADKNGFSLGPFKNFKQVFGDSPSLWLMPVFTSAGDGSIFPVRREHEARPAVAEQEHDHDRDRDHAHGYESMGTTRSSGEDSDETERWSLYPRKGRTVPYIV